MSSDSCPIRVGLIGFGTVGQGTYRMILENQEEIIQKVGAPMEVVRVAVREAGRDRGIPAEMVTGDWREIVDDPSIQVVCELIGGEDPALEMVQAALDLRKHVVTANKELIAKHGSRLISQARLSKLDLHFEAAVGGGIPVVQALKHQLAGNDVISMMGILNGTTNHILTAIRDEGKSFHEALAEAQAAGYAEPDPSNDVDGRDTMYKIAILAAIAFGRQVPLDQIETQGIRSVSPIDFHYAAAFGRTIKLIGLCRESEPGEIAIRVHPALIPQEHQLARVDGVYNALWLHGDFVGDLMFSGRGAGGHPTASAVVGDLIDVGRNIMIGGSGSAIPYGDGMKVLPVSDQKSAFYIRLRVVDKPNTLGRISTLFGIHDVSLAAMEMRTIKDLSEEGEIAFITHDCQVRDFRNALDKLKGEGVVKSLASWMHVEG
jgi:homoserine dehydrogenase